MKMLIALALLAAPALGQTADPAQAAKACRFDIHLWCADARLRQECLVTRWPVLADACQDALVLPAQGSAGAKPGAPAR